MIDPGLLYLVAASLPVLAGLALVWLSRPWRHDHHDYDTATRGERHVRWAGYLAVASIGISAILCLIGLFWYLQYQQSGRDHFQNVEPWAASIPWLSLPRLGFEGKGNLGFSPDAPGVDLRLGYHVDTLTTVLFVLITLVALCIHLYALRSMRREVKAEVYDVLAKVHRPGRYAWFFTVFSFFTGVMLHLVLADNLLQIFFCWELVGLCSYFLIGFYQEQRIARQASIKALIMNRVGDAGFLVGMAILWTFTGTLSLVTVRQEERDVLGNVVMDEGQPKRRIDQLSLTDTLRTPASDTHGEAFEEKGAQAGQMCRVTATRSASGKAKLDVAEAGPLVVVWNQETLNSHFHKPDRGRFDAFNTKAKGGHGKGLRTIPYWLLGLAGVGLFLGCIGKSAQVPLQTWLPDAMAGPTPVSALVHSATMVAAGVYLMARLFPILIPEVLLIIAYIGVFTTFYGATCALVQADVKRLLAYSTLSQLGLMMGAIGVGGWSMALFHLATHACCKALLFLGVGTVVDSCNSVQDIRRLGGLRHQLPVHAGLMLFGCLSLAGLPLLPGWYSKDGILATLVSFGSLDLKHILLAIVPLVTTLLTAVYLTRFWWLIFAGTPRDESVTTNAHEQTGLLRWSLVALVVLALVIVWLPHPLSMENSWFVRLLHQSEPASVRDESNLLINGSNEQLVSGTFKGASWLRPVSEIMHLGPHGLANILAVLALGIGIGLGWWKYRLPSVTPDGAVARFLEDGWRWDVVLQRCFVTPVKLLAQGLVMLDRWLWDGIVHAIVYLTMLLARAEKQFDDHLIDGLVRQTSRATHAAGLALRRVQTGSVQLYLILTALAVISIGALILMLLR
ncbi:MAG TPA: proton-conducting transporter membrane subunit [Gemmatales bacterium]|nr:proton-conducting transporter membrane subunit [Gemmatales bacterium]